MKEEYKRKSDNFLTMISQRVTIVEEMLNGQRPAHQDDAKKFLAEVQQGIERVREIISIS